MADYSALVAGGLRARGEIVQVWCEQFEGFTTAGIQKVNALIDASPNPRRLLVQWVPHGYGRRSMNLEFCRWIAGRKEEIDLMIHEPGLGFWEGGWRHNAAALVHRAMLATLLRSASRVWVSIPAWKRIVRPLLLGRRVPVEAAPVPSNIPVAKEGADAAYPVGYFGHYDPAGIRVVSRLLEALPGPVALLGRGAALVPAHSNAVRIGEADPVRLSRAISSCSVMCHHYTDGINGRRGTAMASLAHGKAVATVEGWLSEPWWRATGAVSLARVGDAGALSANIRKLLEDLPERRRMGTAAAALYRERFAVEHTVAKLLR